MSVPCAICPIPAATAAPAPPDEPPGVMPGSRGFLVSPWIRLVVNQRYENAGQLVRPRITAPALRQLSITGLLVRAITSRCNLSPLVVAKPCWSIFTLTVTGTPASGPASSPRAIAASMAPACASTSAGRWSTTALIDGLTASSRASAETAASLAEIFRDRIQRRKVGSRQTPEVFHGVLRWIACLLAVRGRHGQRWAYFPLSPLAGRGELTFQHGMRARK